MTAEAFPAMPMLLVPEAPPSVLNLADVETFYARETVKITKATRAMLMSPLGRAAASKCFGDRDGETPSQFAARIISTAPPNTLHTALSVGGVSEYDASLAYQCCWVSFALQFAKRCRERTERINRVGNHGKTMLEIAVIGNAEIAVYWLVRSGALPRAPNAFGTTALSRCVESCVKNCVFAIDECVHERMKILMLCEAGEPPTSDSFADAMLYEMMRAVDDPKKQKRGSKK